MITSYSNPKLLNNVELVILFHQSRYLYLRTKYSNMISYNDSYTLLYILRALSENYLISDIKFYEIENDIQNTKNDSTQNLNENILKNIENHLQKKITEINREEESFQNIMRKYAKKMNEYYFEDNLNQEQKNFLDFNCISNLKNNDKFFLDYMDKINFKNQRDIELKESFLKNRDSNSFKEYYQQFINVFGKYKNLLSSIYYCEESKIKITPSYLDKNRDFVLPANIYIAINYSNFYFMDTNLDVLFSLNYSDLVYIYYGEDSQIYIGINYSFETNTKDSIETKNEKRQQLEMCIKLISNESRHILEDLLSYCFLFLALHTNQDEINDKAIFKNIGNIQLLENMNSHDINLNFLKSSYSSLPFDIKNLKLYFQKKLPFSNKSNISDSMNNELDESFFINEGIEAIKKKKNIFDINNNYHINFFTGDITNDKQNEIILNDFSIGSNLFFIV